MHRTTLAVFAAGAAVAALALYVVANQQTGVDEATAAPAAAPSESCDVIIRADGTDFDQELAMPGFSVIAKTADPNFSVSPSPGAKLLAFACDRDDIVPAENDWRILQAGYKLHIRAKGLEGVLEIVDGRVKYHLTDRHDRMGGSDSGRADERVEAFQKLIDANPPKPPVPPTPAAPPPPAPADQPAPAPEAAPAPPAAPAPAPGQ